MITSYIIPLIFGPVDASILHFDYRFAVRAIAYPTCHTSPDLPYLQCVCVPFSSSTCNNSSRIFIDIKGSRQAVERPDMCINRMCDVRLPSIVCEFSIKFSKLFYEIWRKKKLLFTNDMICAQFYRFFTVVFNQKEESGSLQMNWIELNLKEALE